MSTKGISGCSDCGYPLSISYGGQLETCPNCSSINEAISQEVKIPTPLLIGVLAFIGGMFLGPAIVASTSEGQKWLEKQARGG